MMDIASSSLLHGTMCAFTCDRGQKGELPTSLPL